MTKTRAPKGGIEIMGVFYKGGQFLPTNEPQNGKYSRKSKTNNTTQLRKQEIAPYKWESPMNSDQRSIWGWVAGTVAKYNHDTQKLEFCSTPTTLNYVGLSKFSAIELIEQWNNGKRWTKKV